MTTTIPSTSVVVADPVFSDAEQVELAGFLAGYRGLTRDALDLRQFVAGATSTTGACSRYIGLTSSASPATSNSGAGARATVGRRLSTIAGFYRYAEEEGLLAHSPAAHVRRPRLAYQDEALACGPGYHRSSNASLKAGAGGGDDSERVLESACGVAGRRGRDSAREPRCLGRSRGCRDADDM